MINTEELELKGGVKMYKVLKGLAENRLEYKDLSVGKWSDKLRYIEKNNLKIIGVVIKK